MEDLTARSRSQVHLAWESYLLMRRVRSILPSRFKELAGGEQTSQLQVVYLRSIALTDWRLGVKITADGAALFKSYRISLQGGAPLQCSVSEQRFGAAYFDAQEYLFSTAADELPAQLAAHCARVVKEQHSQGNWPLAA